MPCQNIIHCQMLNHNKVTLNISMRLAVEYRTLEAPGLENQVCCTKNQSIKVVGTRVI
jgi:hypothetical protein